MELIYFSVNMLVYMYSSQILEKTHYHILEKRIYILS